MKVLKNNLFSKIFTLIISIVFVLFSVYTYVNIKSERSSSLELMQTYASISISNFILNISPLIVEQDNALIVKNALEVVENNNSIRYITLNLTDNVILFFNKASWKILDKLDLEHTKLEDLKKEKHSMADSSFYKDDIYHYTYPIIVSRKNFGWIHFGFDISNYKQNLKDKYFDIIFISLLAFFITIFTTYFFVKRLTKPIEQLSLNTKKIINNEFEKIVYKENSYEEIDSLSKNFNLMANSIKKSRFEILTINENLEKKVEKRTEELNFLNKDLDSKIKKELEKNSLQEKILFEQTKMLQMSELIKNVSHHWRQPLSVISTIISSINLNNELKNIKDEEDSKNYLIIMENINYLTTTIDVFSNYLETNDQVVNFELNKTIKEVQLLSQNSINEMFININFKPYASHIYIQSQKSNLMQAIINIINNSLEIFEERSIKDKRIDISLEKSDKEVSIIIKDNAEGINENIIDKIFEPYFTTKHKSQGKGMGLYLTYNIIIDKLRGDIKVSNYEKGASFVIKLPL